jgi:hypothetical protein
MNLLQKVFGLVLLMIGLGTLVSGVFIAHLDRAGIHWGHMILSLVLLFIGGWLLNRALAEGIADAILKRVPALATLWPGGRRASDPPPDPKVPPPPGA